MDAGRREPGFQLLAWGQDIGGVPIWFSVNYSGVTGYYASYFDDSSYHSNEELTAKYGVPLCGSAPPAAGGPPAASPAPPVQAPVASPPVAPPAAGPVAVYFNPYANNDPHGAHEIADGRTLDFERKSWESSCLKPNENLRAPYQMAIREAKGRPITTVSGWSAGRVGVWLYLAKASSAQLKQVNYGLVIDPGNLSELECDSKRHAGDAFAEWLHVNPLAHLVIISAELSQEEHSRGIQEAYFNAMREGAYPEVTSRVLTCNYPIDHQQAFLASKYWIQHQIGSTRNACPQFSVNGSSISATVGWHPINN